MRLIILSLLRLIILSLLLLSMIGCGSENECDNAIPNILSDIEIDDNISLNVNLDAQKLFSNTVATNYVSGSYCNDNYQFDQYNPDEHDWCYYISVDVDCNTNKISSIYSVY